MFDKHDPHRRSVAVDTERKTYEDVFSFGYFYEVESPKQCQAKQSNLLIYKILSDFYII
jgi:hypothetical protein